MTFLNLPEKTDMMFALTLPEKPYIVKNRGHVSNNLTGDTIHDAEREGGERERGLK